MIYLHFAFYVYRIETFNMIHTLGWEQTLFGVNYF